MVLFVVDVFVLYVLLLYVVDYCFHFVVFVDDGFCWQLLFLLPLLLLLLCGILII